MPFHIVPFSSTDTDGTSQELPYGLILSSGEHSSDKRLTESALRDALEKEDDVSYGPPTIRPEYIGGPVGPNQFRVLTLASRDEVETANANLQCSSKPWFAFQPKLDSDYSFSIFSPIFSGKPQL